MQQSFTIGRLLVYWVVLLTCIVKAVPGFAQGYVEDGKRYAMFSLYHYGDVDGTMQKRQIKSMEDAFANGCNSVVIGIDWGTLQPSLNSPPDWAYVDRFFQVAQQHNAKVAIRLRTCRVDRTGFWPEEQSMRDHRGNMLQIESNTHVRLGYTPAIDKIQDFVRSVAQRYKYINDRGDLLFMSVTFNPQWENEYWQTNHPGNYLASYDFNELTIADFQRWALAKYNNSLATLNSTWGTNYKAVTDIRPTYPDNNLLSGFPGKRGADWYIFRHLQLKSFNDRFATTVKSVDPTIRIVTEQGSIYDLISGNRGTLGFKNMAQLYDGIKVNDGIDYTHQLSMDLIRSNMKPGALMINEIDGANFLADRIDRSADQATMAETNFKYGAKIITFANFYSDANGEYLKAILDKIKAKGLLNQPVSTVTPVGTMTYKLSATVQSNFYESGVLGQWNTIRGGSEGKPVRILIDEDLLANVGNPPQNQVPTVVNRVPNQTAVVNRTFSFKIPDNTFADADGQITSVAISGLPAGLNYDAASRIISGTPSLIGSNEITVTATDNNNATVTDYFVLAVKRATLPLQLLDPVLDCSTGRFELRSTEGDGSAVEYAVDNVYTWNTQTVYTLAGQLRSGSALTIRARQSGTELSLIYTTTCPASTTVNKPPVVNSPLADQTLTAGQAFSVVLPGNTFTDTDGTIASVSLSNLPTGITYTPATRVLAGTVANPGTWTVTATATDDKGATVSTTFKITVGTTSGPKPLRLLPPLLDCATGRFEFQSADGDGTPVEYAADNLFSYTTRSVYTLVDLFRFASVPITVRARQSGVEVLLYYPVNCPSVANRGPIVNVPIADQTNSVNKTVSISIPASTFTDPDGQVVSMAVNGLPTGLSYDPTTRLITGTVTTTGVWNVTVVATDDKGATGSTTFNLTIASQAKPLRLLDPVLNCDTGLFEFRSADGDGSPVEYSIDRLINWTTQSSFTLALSMRSNTQLDIKARQGGQLVSGVYRPNCPAPNQLPTVKTLLADQALTQFRNLSLVIPTTTFEDADGTIDGISLTGLPPGLSYAATTRTVSGAPTTPGTWTVTATATDNRGGTVETTFVMTVALDPSPLRLLDPVLNCDTGLFEFRSAGGDGSPVEYSIDRLINWTTQSSFTLALGMRSNTQLDLKARQGNQLVSGVYRPNCPAPNQLPTVKTALADVALTQFRNMSLVIAANTFEDADGTIEAVGLAGLPPGLSYAATTRTVSGAPTISGTWTVTATATDNRGGTVATTFVVTVAPQAKPLRLLDPLIDCATGKLEFQTADGDGTAISYSIDQVLNWTSQSIYTLADGPRYGTALVLRVRQSGFEKTLAYTTPCVRQNKPPVVAVPITDQVLIVNQPASFTVPASTFIDPDGAITSVTLTGLPVGLSYDPIKRVVQGTPTLIGSSPAVARATDNAGASVADTFLITVRAAPRFAVTTTLLDAQGRVLKDLVDGDLLDSKKMPLLANLSCQPKVAAGSVLMELTGKAKRTVYANAAPYLLYPAGQGFKPDIGSYQLKVSVYSGANGTGTLLGTATVRFDIIVPNEGG